jgi:hypothetical protein
MTTDLTFFTNEPDSGSTLLDRFRQTFARVQYLDILEGYFRTSGFHLLHEALEDVEKIRVLVGLSVDRQREAGESLVQRLLDAPADDPRQAAWEAELNGLVYELYGLTPAEIALVEEATRG